MKGSLDRTSNFRGQMVNALAQNMYTFIPAFDARPDVVQVREVVFK
jgi:hypothetical protein